VRIGSAAFWLMKNPVPSGPKKILRVDEDGRNAEPWGPLGGPGYYGVPTWPTRDQEQIKEE